MRRVILCWDLPARIQTGLSLGDYWDCAETKLEWRKLVIVVIVFFFYIIIKYEIIHKIL